MMSGYSDELSWTGAKITLWCYQIIIKQFLWFLVSTQKQNSMEEIGQNFHICLRSGPRWLTPPSPPYGQPDRKISVFFDNSLKDDEHSGNSRYDNGRRWWSWWTSRWLPSWAKTLVSNAIRGEGGDEASWHDQTSLKDKHFENRPHEYIAPVAWLNVHSRESIRIVGKS